MTSRFTVSSTAFAKAVAQVASVVPTGAIVPILETVLLVGTGSVVGQAATIKLVCSNFETQLSAELSVECFENFTICLPAKKLLATLKGFPDAPITCEVDEAGRVFELTVGRSRYKLAGEAPTDFPKVLPLDKEHTSFTLPANHLRSALAATLVFAPTNDGRPAMNSIMIEATNETLCFVGIGGNRVGVWQFDEENEDEVKWSKPGKFLIPRQAAQLLHNQLDAKSAEPVTILIDKTNARLEGGGWVGRLMDEFPIDYRAIMPGFAAEVVDVDRDEMLSALRRLSNYTPDDTDVVSLSIGSDGELKLHAENYQWSSEGSEIVSCDYSGAPLCIAFPSVQLTQLLSVWPSGRIRFSLNGSNRPALLTLASEEDAPVMTCLIAPCYLPAAVAA